VATTLVAPSSTHASKMAVQASALATRAAAVTPCEVATSSCAAMVGGARTGQSPNGSGPKLQRPAPPRESGMTRERSGLEVTVMARQRLGGHGTIGRRLGSTAPCTQAAAYWAEATVVAPYAKI
jgi:hypothetical protein